MPPRSRSTTSKAVSAPKPLGFSSTKRTTSLDSKKKSNSPSTVSSAATTKNAKSELSGLYQSLYKKSLKKMGKPVHKDEFDDIELILRQFDQEEEFGPCSRISRLERFERARKLGLNPDPEIGEILRSQEGRNRKEYSESVFQNRLLCASGGKDGICMLWDLNEGKHLYSLEAGDIINALVFSPNRYWLCAAVGSSIKVFDLESKTLVEEIRPEFDISAGAREPDCTSLAWSADGSTLFAGFSDNVTRVYSVMA